MDAMVVAQPQEPNGRPPGHAEEIDLLRELLTGSRAESLDSLRVLALVELDDVVNRVEPCGLLVLDFRVVDEGCVADAIQKPEIRAGDVRRQLPRRPRFFIWLVLATIVGNRA